MAATFENVRSFPFVFLQVTQKCNYRERVAVSVSLSAALRRQAAGGEATQPFRNATKYSLSPMFKRRPRGVSDDLIPPQDSGCQQRRRSVRELLSTRTWAACAVSPFFVRACELVQVESLGKATAWARVSLVFGTACLKRESGLAGPTEEAGTTPCGVHASTTTTHDHDHDHEAGGQERTVHDDLPTSATEQEPERQAEAGANNFQRVITPYAFKGRSGCSETDCLAGPGLVFNSP